MSELPDLLHDVSTQLLNDLRAKCDAAGLDMADYSIKTGMLEQGDRYLFTATLVPKVPPVRFADE